MRRKPSFGLQSDVSGREVHDPKTLSADLVFDCVLCSLNRQHSNRNDAIASCLYKLKRVLKIDVWVIGLARPQLLWLGVTAQAQSDNSDFDFVCAITTGVGRDP